MRTAAVTTLLVLGLGVAATGCSAEEAEPSTLPPVAPASAPDAAPVPEARSSSPAAPGSSASAPPLMLPEEADAVPVAAAAFTRYFFGVVNAAYLNRRAEPVARLASAKCGSCSAVIADITRLSTEGHRVSGRRYVLSAAEAAPERSDGRVVVDFRFTTEPYIERNKAGKLIQQFPAEPVRDGQLMLEPAAGQWRVAAIRLVDG